MSRRQPAPCIVTDCAGITNVPGTARGYCSMHYQRWQRHGNALIKSTRAFVNKGQVCAYDGCKRDARQLGYCGTHASRVRRNGTTDDVRAFANAPEGMKWCACCQSYKSIGEFFLHRSKPDGRSIECKPCGRARSKDWRRRNPDKVKAMSERRTDSGASAANGRRYRKRNPAAKRSQGASQRVRRKGVERSPYKKADIYERDKWTCGICGKPILKSCAYPDPMSPSIDHMIPIAFGGPDKPENIQAAHLRCNLRKHLHARNEQLRLVG